MISVVIPYLSGWEDLKSCIVSLNKQQVKPEVIVVNDSGKKLDLRNVKIINNDETRGAAYSRNVGFEESSSEVVLFVDQDITFKNGGINKMLRKIKTFDIVFPKVVYENGRIMHPIGKEKESPQISACFMVKKRSVEKLNEFFDETYQIYLEDADFFLRAKLAGLKSCYVEDAIAVHKLKKGYNERRFYLENRNLVYGIKKFLFVNTKGVYHPFHFRSLASNFVCALFNFNKFDWSHYDRCMPTFGKVNLLFNKHKKLTDGSRLVLIYYFFKAFFG